MSHALNIATHGHLYGDASLFGYLYNIESITVIDPPLPEIPITDNKGDLRYSLGVESIMGGIGGVVSGQKPKFIEVIFIYQGDTYKQIRAINPNITINIENFEIEIINNKPVVVLKEFEKTSGKQWKK